MVYIEATPTFGGKPPTMDSEDAELIRRLFWTTSLGRPNALLR